MKIEDIMILLKIKEKNIENILGNKSFEFENFEIKTHEINYEDKVFAIEIFNIVEFTDGMMHTDYDTSIVIYLNKEIEINTGIQIGYNAWQFLKFATIKTETVLNMNNKDIAEFLTHEEIQKAEEKYRTLSNFVDVYQDAARLSNEDEFITPNEYLGIMLEQDEEHEEDVSNWDF